MAIPRMSHLKGRQFYLIAITLLGICLELGIILVTPTVLAEAEGSRYIYSSAICRYRV